MSKLAATGAFEKKRVLLTGHTGFKGAWLALWLSELGAEVHGFALAENPSPATYTALGVRSLLESERLADLGSFEEIRSFAERVRPEVVFHLAAQPLVRESYRDPLGTLQTNFMGTANLLEAVRLLGTPVACVAVTSDKCYENPETGEPCRETDRMGGLDVYSMSKGACELLISSYRRGFFTPGAPAAAPVRLASARAGNAIGGGDYAGDRIVADSVRALTSGKPIRVRNPDSVRPWQHVLEPVSGYLELARRLLADDGDRFCEGFNFGPRSDDVLKVRDVAQAIVARWGSGSWSHEPEAKAPHESRLLRLDVTKAERVLAWRPTWDARRAITETIDWYKLFEQGGKAQGSMREFSVAQLARFESERKRGDA